MASNTWVYGPLSITWTPSTTSQGLTVNLYMEGNLIGLALLTQNNPNYSWNYTSGNNSTSGTLSAQFAQAGGQSNLLFGNNIIAKSLTQAPPPYTGVVGTWS